MEIGADIDPRVVPSKSVEDTLVKKKTKTKLLWQLVLSLSVLD